MLQPLRFGVIGTGRFGKHYIRLLQNMEGAALVGTASRHEGDASELIASLAVDCLIIATPASTHLEYVKAALGAGKHVLVEKPMALSFSAAREYARLVRQTGKTFMVGHQFLFNEHIIALKQKIDRGELGEMGNIYAEHLYPGPQREDIGVFWDAAAHELAILDYLFGPSEVKHVQGVARQIGQGKVDNFVFVDVEFVSQIFVSFLYSSIAPVKSHRLLLAGEKSLGYYDDAAPKAYEPLRKQLEHFIICVREDRIPLTDVHHGLRITKNLETIYKQLVA